MQSHILIQNLKQRAAEWRKPETKLEFTNPLDQMFLRPLTEQQLALPISKVKDILRGLKSKQ